MPENKNIKRDELPMKLCFGEKPQTNFVNNLDSIEVELLDWPDVESLMRYIPSFIRATWDTYPNETGRRGFLSEVEKLSLVQDVFFDRTLPTAKETINFVFRIQGISLIEATHLIRYRGASFSADCSADKWHHRRDALIPNSIQNCSELYEKLQKNIEENKQIYCDLIDSGEVSISDARYILPRCLDTFYYMKMNLNDVVHFIRQRVDRQMQPETDNIIAYQMYLALLRTYPFINNLIDIDAQDKMYLKVVNEHGRMYIPEHKNDVFDWNRDNFMYPKKRSEMNGTDDGAEYYFDKQLKEYMRSIEGQYTINDEIMMELYGINNESLHKMVVKRR